MPHTISEQTIREVAKLARLNLTDQEAKLFSSQLGDVLGAIDQLKQLDVENVKPMPMPMTSSMSSVKTRKPKA